MRVAATLVLVLVAAGCGSVVPPSQPASPSGPPPRPPGQPARLLTGVDPDRCFLGGEAGQSGLLTDDAEFGTRFGGVPVMWPIGFTAMRYPTGVDVLNADGKVLARTGRVYYISIAPVKGPDMFDTGGAYPAAASCGEPWDFVDCGPPPGSGDAVPGQRGVCSLEQPPPPSPAPAVDPEILRKALRAAFVKAETTASVARRALDEKTSTHPTLNEALAYYRELAQIERTYLGSLEAPGVDVPPDMHKDYHMLTVDQFRVLIKLSSIAGSRSMATLKVHQEALAAAQDEMAAATAHVRSDLKLPPAGPA